MSSYESDIWNRHQQFALDRHSMALIQSPHKVSQLLYGEVLEVGEALEQLLPHPTQKAKQEALFELADVYIYTMTLAHLLKRDDLREHMEFHLQPGSTKLHTLADSMNTHEKVGALHSTSSNLQHYMEATPDHEMSAQDEIFTQSILAFAALTGSMARDISDIPFRHVIAAKIAYNEYRYPSHAFSYPGHEARFHYGKGAFRAYDAARRSQKAIAQSLPLGQEDFLEMAVQAA